MKEVLERKNREIGELFLKKIEKYKKKNNVSYSDIASEVGIDIYIFGNLRSKIKKHGMIPSKKILSKFEEKGII